MAFKRSGVRIPLPPPDRFTASEAVRAPFFVFRQDARPSGSPGKAEARPDGGTGSLAGEKSKNAEGFVLFRY